MFNKIQRLNYKLLQWLKTFNVNPTNVSNNNSRLQVGRATDQPEISGTPCITFSHAQSVGLVRSNNEDSVFSLIGCSAGDSTNDSLGIFVVADGMGGHAKGERASAVAVQSIIKSLGNYLFSQLPEISNKSIDTERTINLIESAMIQANLAVKDIVPGGGTTTSILLLIGQTAFVGHVGDSRVYVLESENLIQITKHHFLF